MIDSHYFNIKEAEKLGIEKAVILQNFRFWLTKNAANESHKHDGYYWTYNSAHALQRLFPYFSERKIHRLLTQLVKEGILISGNYNKSGYDRTKWYSIPLEFSYDKNGKCIDQNCQMDMSEVVNGSTKTVGPIPDSKPDNKPDNIYSNLDFSKWPELPGKEFLEELLALRKKKKLSNSSIAFNTIGAQMSIAASNGFRVDQCIGQWITSGWSSFKAEYMLNNHQSLNDEGSILASKRISADLFNNATVHKLPK